MEVAESRLILGKDAPLRHLRGVLDCGKKGGYFGESADQARSMLVLQRVFRTTGSERGLTNTLCLLCRSATVCRVTLTAEDRL